MEVNGAEENKPMQEENKSSRKPIIILKGLTKNIRKEHLEEICQKELGGFVRIEHPEDKQYKVKKSFCFLHFENMEHAEEAWLRLDGA